VTNHHVIADAVRIRVRTSKVTFPATVVRADPTSDLAILKVTGGMGDFSALPVRGSGGPPGP
jgi:S1-C subfamily serine protease